MLYSEHLDPGVSDMSMLQVRGATQIYLVELLGNLETPALNHLLDVYFHQVRYSRFLMLILILILMSRYAIPDSQKARGLSAEISPSEMRFQK